MRPEYQWAYAAGVVAVAVLLAAAVRLLIRRTAVKLIKRTATTLDNALWKIVAGPIGLGIILAALCWAVRQPDVLRQYLAAIDTALAAAGFALAGWVLMAVVRSLIQRYAEQQAAKTGIDVDTHVLPLLKNSSAVLIGVITLALILDRMNVKLTALIASLGVASIAVALALQDTLSNLFAGFYIAIDRPVKTGDYVRLDTGDEGFVDSIGWRTTKLRMLANNLVVIPNNKLSSSVITNYELPSPDMGLVIPCGVAYGSDLDKVERITIETAKSVMRTAPGGVCEFEPFVRFNRFGDSNIEFSIILRVRSFADRYLVTHRFIKELACRYRRENIEISYPVRKLVREGTPPVD